MSQELPAPTLFPSGISDDLANCEDCRIVVDTLRKTILLYRTLPPPSPPESIRLRLFHALKLDS